MKSLLTSCKNFGSKECHPDVSKYYPRELKEGEDIPILPVGEELDKADAICAKCDSRFFDISEKRCPVCGSQEFIEIKDSIKISEMNSGEKKVEAFYFTCKHCESPLKLIKIF